MGRPKVFNISLVKHTLLKQPRLSPKRSARFVSHSVILEAMRETSAVSSSKNRISNNISSDASAHIASSTKSKGVIDRKNPAALFAASSALTFAIRISVLRRLRQ